MAKTTVPVISFVGPSNCGKTTYLEKLIKEMKLRGYKVAAVKHDAHGFEMDKPGKDTWRHSEAGADVVAISSFGKMAMIKKVDQELTLEEVTDYIKGVDIIFTEGYKKEGKIKIEIFRHAVCQQPICRQEDVLAFVADTVVYETVPHFSLEDINSMADFLIRKFLNH